MAWRVYSKQGLLYNVLVSSISPISSVNIYWLFIGAHLEFGHDPLEYDLKEEVKEGRFISENEHVFGVNSNVIDTATNRFLIHLQMGISWILTL